MEYSKIIFVADNSEKAQVALKTLTAIYDSVEDIMSADVIVVLGGDGFMLHTFHKYMDAGKPFFGMNCGSIGFLMNSYREDNLISCINDSKEAVINPLLMKAKTTSGEEHHAVAINEVSLLRQTKQTASIKISVDDRVRLEELVCDGILCSTSAGSTAYNLSVHGPILPIGCDLLALTPISPFRPRRWKGALLSRNTKVEIEILDFTKRPVSAVADFHEVRNVKTVEISEEKNKNVTLLFDKDHSLEERIIREQFTS